MKTINIEIFAENEDFYAEMDLFMCRSYEYKIIKNRIILLDNILDTEESRDSKIDYFLGNGLNGKYHFDNLIGEIYSSAMVDAISLHGTTHTIKSVTSLDLKYSAEVVILDTLYGKGLQLLPEDILVLRPVYTHLTKNQFAYNKSIMTFNIDYRRGKIA